MIKLLTYTFIIISFIAFNIFMIRGWRNLKELKILSKQAKALPDNTRKSIRAGMEPVVAISEIKDDKRWKIVFFVAGFFIFFLALYSDEFISTFVFYYFLSSNSFNRGYGMFFEILPNGLILQNRFTSWQEMKSYELIQITPNHKYYGFDLEVNNTTELLIKLNNRKNSFISYTITDINVLDDIVLLLQENGVFEENDINVK